MDQNLVCPLDYEQLVESAKRTGRVVLASDACERGSFLHTMASTINRLAFGQLDAPPVVVGSRNWITPGPELEAAFFPQPSWILDAIHEHILPLKGHVPVSNQSSMEYLRRSRLGV
jgi:2-oxoisovalerate dehydrogenase E1 component